MANRLLHFAVTSFFLVANGFALAGDESPQPSTSAMNSSQQTAAKDLEGWRGFPNKAMSEPIICPKGARKRVDAMTLGELFAGKWHDQPKAMSSSEIQDVFITSDQHPVFPLDFHGFHETPPRGYVEVMAIIGADDSVVDARVTCSTDNSFEKNALQAARTSRYKAASVAGKPVASVIRRPYLFGLKK